MREEKPPRSKRATLLKKEGTIGSADFRGRPKQYSQWEERKKKEKKGENRSTCGALKGIPLICIRCFRRGYSDFIVLPRVTWKWKGGEKTAP